MLPLSRPFLFALLLVAPLLFGCATADDSAAPDGPDSVDPNDAVVPEVTPEGPEAEDVVSGVGTIRYIQIEGGFYGLVADDGTQYLPQNLEERFREDGLQVRFRGETVDGVATIQMWGTPLRLLEIMQLDEID